MNLFDPPPTWDEYVKLIDPALSRPLTDPGLGAASRARRRRCAQLSALMLGRERARRRLIRSPWTGRAYMLDGSVWSGTKKLEDPVGAQ